jgi:hypothetical protein
MEDKILNMQFGVLLVSGNSIFLKENIFKNLETPPPNRNDNSDLLLFWCRNLVPLW